MLKRSEQLSPIAIDIGATAVRVVQLAFGERETALAAVAYEEIPRDAWAGPLRPDAVRAALAEALRRGRFIGRDAITCLSSNDYTIKSIRLPPMPAEELAAAAEFEAQERFALAAGAAEYRFITAGEVRHGNELKQELIVFAGLSEAIAARLALLESMRLRPLGIDAAPCAMARSFARFFRRADDTQTVNLFLDVGYRSTAAVITRGVEINFLKVIDIGGEHLTQAVAAALNIPIEEAARLRTRIMRQDGGRRAADKSELPEELKHSAADAVRSPIERLAREVQLCLRYFAVTFRGQRPICVTFVGGEAHEPELTRIVSEVVDVPCTIGNPLRGLARNHMAGGPDRRTLTPSWAVAVGLALRDAPLRRRVQRSTAEPTVLETAAT